MDPGLNLGRWVSIQGFRAVFLGFSRIRVARLGVCGPKSPRREPVGSMQEGPIRGFGERLARGPWLAGRVPIVQPRPPLTGPAVSDTLECESSDCKEAG